MEAQTLGRLMNFRASNRSATLIRGHPPSDLDADIVEGAYRQTVVVLPMSRKTTNRALTATEVKQLYKFGTAIIKPN